jgi:hypothetical protein
MMTHIGLQKIKTESGMSAQQKKKKKRNQNLDSLYR